MEIEKEKVSLKEHFEKILAEKDKYLERVLIEKDKALSAALSTAKEAVAVAEKNAEKWRDNANEWRGAMNDKDKLLMQRAEFSTFKEGYEKEMDELKTRSDKGEGKSEGYAKFLGWILAAIAIAAFIIDKIN
jgi:hypothetical protein